VTLHKSFSIGIILVFLTACSSGKGLQGKRNFSATASPLQFSSSDPEVVERKILAIMTFADQSYEWRRRAVSIFPIIENNKDFHNGRILSKDLVAIHALATRYVRRIRRPLILLLDSPYLHMDLDNEIQIQTERDTYVERQVTWYQDSTGRTSRNKGDLEEENIHQEYKADVYHLNPRDSSGQAFLKEFKVSLAASLLLLDNFAIGLEPYLSDKHLRRSLLYDTPDSQWNIRNEIKDIWLSYERYHQSSKLIHAVEIYNKINILAPSGEDFALDPWEQELNDVIEVSLTFREWKHNPRRKGLLKRIYEKARRIGRRPRDNWFRIRFHATRLLSKGFSNSAGVIKFRDGKLKHLSRAVHDDLVSQMKPLDILLEKTPFRLTDKFIPGYYGHVAIWVGTERELREAGIWNELPYCVEIHTLRDFLNIDDLAVLRVHECPEGSTGPRFCMTSKKKREYLLEVFRQIGKDYDFNFNVNTETAIVCSELAYRTFYDVDFQTRKTLGKHSISPEQVLLKGDSRDDPFYPVLMYFNGKRLPGDQEFLRRLLKFLVKEDVDAVENAIQSQAGLK